MQPNPYNDSDSPLAQIHKANRETIRRAVAEADARRRQAELSLTPASRDFPIAIAIGIFLFTIASFLIWLFSK